MANLMSLKCKGCGGTVEYYEGQGLFKCRFCGSVYETDDGGQGAVKAIKVVEQRLESIEAHTQATAGMATEGRLQKKAQEIQDKIDYMFIEFDNSSGRKAGSYAILLWILGGLMFFVGLAASGFRAPGIVIGLFLIGAGVGLYFLYRKAKETYEANIAYVSQSELTPVYDQLRELGSLLPGGAVSVGYMESTSVPQRYCVICHQNVMPVKDAGGTHGLFHGTNLILTVLTCGLWIPAWLIMTAMMKTGSVAKRAMKSGRCSMCGTSTLFPARIPNTQANNI